jgi:chromatin remodeling complex protein RSC6
MGSATIVLGLLCFLSLSFLTTALEEAEKSLVSTLIARVEDSSRRIKALEAIVSTQYLASSELICQRVRACEASESWGDKDKKKDKDKDKDKDKKAKKKDKKDKKKKDKEKGKKDDKKGKKKEQEECEGKEKGCWWAVGCIGQERQEEGCWWQERRRLVGWRR